MAATGESRKRGHRTRAVRTSRQPAENASSTAQRMSNSRNLVVSSKYFRMSVRVQSGVSSRSLEAYSTRVSYGAASDPDDASESDSSSPPCSRAFSPSKSKGGAPAPCRILPSSSGIERLRKTILRTCRSECNARAVASGFIHSVPMSSAGSDFAQPMMHSAASAARRCDRGLSARTTPAVCALKASKPCMLSCSPGTASGSTTARRRSSARRARLDRHGATPPNRQPRSTTRLPPAPAPAPVPEQRSAFSSWRGCCTGERVADSMAWCAASRRGRCCSSISSRRCCSASRVSPTLCGRA
mmetsp:Transcript_19386/g.64033  ORF Transcript_19386/g.64033 Transcript_19386/m.64033 type:complete len:300 (-) Transcript_19386:28-927(-)